MLSRSRCQAMVCPLLENLSPEMPATGPSGACSPGSHFGIEQREFAGLHRQHQMHALDSARRLACVHLDAGRCCGVGAVGGGQTEMQWHDSRP